jgi:hypothetical protein
MSSSREGLPTPEEALKLLEPYRGRKGRFRAELGEEGIRALWVVAAGSPTTGAEFLGYKSYAPVSADFAKLDLPTRKRDWSDPQAGWQRFDNELSIDDKRQAYLLATGSIERAPLVEWVVPDGTEYAVLIVLGDTHYGEASMDYRRWLDLCDWIGEHPHVRWVHHGDVYDQALAQSPGRSMQRQAIDFQDARDLAREDMRPIAAQCEGIIEGNHDLRIARATQANYAPARELARELGVRYLGEESFVRYRVTTESGDREQNYLGYHIHGTGGGDAWGGFCNRMEKIVNRNRCDFAAHGHFHKLISLPINHREVAMEDGQIGTVEVSAIGTGSFLKLEGGGYGAAKGYAPPSLGAGTFHLYLDRHAVHARV